MSAVNLIKEERVAALSRAVKAWAEVDRYLAVVLVAAILVSISAWRFVLEKQASARRAQDALNELVLAEPTEPPPAAGTDDDRNQFIGGLRGTALNQFIDETLAAIRDLDARSTRRSGFDLPTLRDDDFQPDPQYEPHDLAKFLEFLERDGMRGDAVAVAAARPLIVGTGLGTEPIARLELLLQPELASTALDERARLRTIYAALPEATPYALDNRRLASIKPELAVEVEAIVTGAREDVQIDLFPAPLPLREALMFFPAGLALAAVVISSSIRAARSEAERHGTLTETLRAAGEANGMDMNWLRPAAPGFGVARVVTLLLAGLFSALAFYFTPKVIGADPLPAWAALVFLALSSCAIAVVASFPVGALRPSGRAMSGGAGSDGATDG